MVKRIENINNNDNNNSSINNNLNHKHNDNIKSSSIEGLTQHTDFLSKNKNSTMANNCGGYLRLL